MTDITNNKTDYEQQTFCDIDWSNQKIIDKTLTGCTFTTCNFSNTLFKGCRLVDCQFIKCNLSLIGVNNSKFVDTLFQDCKLIGVDWTMAYWRGITFGSPLKFQRCIIDSSSFYGLDQSQVVIEDCKAHDVDFREANCRLANFSSTDLLNSLFKNTDLTEADFSEAINYDIDINHNTIKHAKFCRQEASGLLECLDIQLVD